MPSRRAWMMMTLGLMAACFGAPPARPLDRGLPDAGMIDGAPPDLSPDAYGGDAGPCVPGVVRFGRNLRVSLAGTAAAEVSAAASPSGRVAIAFCDLTSGRLDVSHADASTLSFAAPVGLAPAFCDPTLAYATASGTFFLADDCATADGGYGICVHTSTDGASWSAGSYVDQYTRASGGLVDRPWIFAAANGAGPGALLTWNRYPPPLTSNVGYTFAADVSAAGVASAPAMLTSGNPTSTSAPGATAPAGDAYAVGNVATDLQPASEHGPMKLWSRPAGGTWSESDVPSPGGPIYVYPAIAVTPKGTLLVLYTDEASAIFLIRSTDDGATWSTPLRVNPASATPHTLLLWAASGADGIGRFTWYEAVPGTSGSATRWNVYYARSVDDGLTVSAPVRVNDGGPFPGTNGEYDESYRSTTAPWLGDFTAVFTDGTRDYVAFTDNRDPTGSAVWLAPTDCE